MNKKERDYFTQLILEERRRKLSALGRLQGTLDEINESRAAEYEEEVTLSDDKEYLSKLIEQDARGLEEINKSLEKVLDGSYGKCENCGNEINRDRLEAIPTTVLCMDCKQQQEQESLGGRKQREERVQRITLPGEEEGDREDLSIGEED
jgi:DnaK suppressor protein